MNHKKLCLFERRAKVYAIFEITKSTDYLRFTNYCVIQKFLLWEV